MDYRRPEAEQGAVDAKEMVADPIQTPVITIGFDDPILDDVQSLPELAEKFDLNINALLDIDVYDLKCHLTGPFFDGVWWRRRYVKVKNSAKGLGSKDTVSSGTRETSKEMLKV